MNIKVIVYGLGHEFELLRKLIEKDYEIVGYSDKRVVNIENYIIPSDICLYNYDAIFITCEKYYVEIKEELEKILGKTKFLNSYYLTGYYDEICTENIFQGVELFYKVDGNNRLLRECSLLNKESIVFELGGYKGDWIRDIYVKYGCECYVFEPVKEYCDIIQKELGKYSKIHIYNIGIGISTYDTEINVSEDGSSIYSDGKSENIHMKALGEFLKENYINKIDLIQINIEGGEYDLLEWMIETGYILNVQNIQIQFHDKKEINAEKRMKDIQLALKRTHICEWAYRPYVWEKWVLKNR